MFEDHGSDHDLMIVSKTRSLWVRLYRRHPGDAGLIPTSYHPSVGIDFMVSTSKDEWPEQPNWVGEPLCWEIEE